MTARVSGKYIVMLNKDRRSLFMTIKLKIKDNKRKRRSHRINLVILSVIAIMIVVALGLIVNSFSGSTSASPNLLKKKDKVEAEVSISTIESEFPGIQIRTETLDDANKPFTLSYPRSEHEAFNDQVSSYIEEWKTRYAAVQEETKSATPNGLTISFDTVEHSSGTYSFVVTSSMSMSGDEQQDIRTFRLNPQSGTELQIADVVDQNVEKLKRLTKAVRDSIYNDSKLQDTIRVDNVWLATEPVWRNYRNFALSDDSLIFYYETGVLAEKKQGPVTVQVPLQKVNPFLANKYQVAVEPSSEKLVSLTFDDGPDPRYTEKILASLEKYDAKATFFMLGSRVEKYPEMAKKVVAAGHEVGNHSWNHPPLTGLTDEQLHVEVKGTEDVILRVTGQHATVFRPPYGLVDQRVRESSKLPVVLWSIDTLDWKHRNAKKMLENVETHAKHNSIVLMHDIQESTARGIDPVLEFFHSQGYKFVTVSEIDEY